VYVPTWKAGGILELDARSLATSDTMNWGANRSASPSRATGCGCYSGNERGWLDLVHLPTGQIVRRKFATPADEVALTPDQSVVYASLRTAGQGRDADAHTLECVGTLEPGGLPRHIAFDKLGSLAIVANEAGWVRRRAVAHQHRPRRGQ